MAPIASSTNCLGVSIRASPVLTRSRQSYNMDEVNRRHAVSCGGENLPDMMYLGSGTNLSHDPWVDLDRI